jgi:hypothetical protein
VCSSDLVRSGSPELLEDRYGKMKQDGECS